jgi:hypothetical protein
MTGISSRPPKERITTNLRPRSHRKLARPPPGSPPAQVFSLRLVLTYTYFTSGFLLHASDIQNIKKFVSDKEGWEGNKNEEKERKRQLKCRKTEKRKHRRKNAISMIREERSGRVNLILFSYFSTVNINERHKT